MLSSILLLWLVSVTAPCLGLVTNSRKFDFLPLLSQSYFAPISTGPCNQTLALYDGFWNGTITSFPDIPELPEDVQEGLANQKNRGKPVGIADAIYFHQQCILDNMEENVKATMASAGILLGLAPVLLQATGPSLNELGLLAAHRPLLAKLMTLGTAAVYPSRIFGYRESLAFDLVEEPSLLPEHGWLLLTGGRRRRIVVSLLQYALVAVAIFNVIYTSVQLGAATIATFDCANSIFPLIWTLGPIAVHLPTFIGFWVSRRGAAKQRKSVIRDEFTICVAQEPLPDQCFKLNFVASCLHWVASVISFVHGAMGILVFSSLLFVEIVDALVILLRYFASVLACRAIIAFEISGMRAAREQTSHKYDPIKKDAPASSQVPNMFTGGETNPARQWP